MGKKRSLVILSALCALLMCTAMVWQCEQASAETLPGLCINEVCAKEDANGALHRENPAKPGEFCDWVELYNCSEEPISMEGLYLTDDLEKKPTNYALPAIEIPAHDYFIIYCAKKVTPNEGEYIAQFGISEGDTVYLTDGVNIIDSLYVKKSVANKTIARYPDGDDSRNTCTDATPYAANGFTIEPPEVLAESGFYDPFDLEMTTDQEDVKIVYTIDGKTPTADSPEYTGPVALKDASPNKNVYSARKDLSTLYNTSLCKRCGMSGWIMKPPTKKVDKAVRLKARCIDSEGNMSEVVNKIYFVGLGGKSAYKNVHIVSIQAPFDSLFGYKNGMYNTGAKYTGKNNNKMAGTSGLALRYYCNYSLSRTRKGTVTYFEDSTSAPVAESADLSLKGHLSRGYPQKSWNVKGADKLSFTLDTDGLNNAYKLKDPVGTGIAGDNMNFEHSTFTPAQVFLNGEYWGYYNMGQRLFSKKHYAKKYDISKDSVAIIKQGRRNEGTSKDLKDYKDMMSYIKSHDMRVGSHYNYISKKINIDSMVDYYCMEVYASNKDWRPTWNYAMWRSAEYDEGRWNYILWDLNVSSCFEERKRNMMTFTFSNDPYFRSMYKNATFRKKFTSRFNELSQTNFKPSNATAVLTSVYEQNRPYAKTSLARWYEGKKGVGGYDRQYKTMKTFIKYRASNCKSHIASVNKQYKYTKAGTSGLKFSLSKSSYTYDGNAKTPTVTVKNASGTKLKQDVDYTVTYTKNTDKGTAYAKIKMIGGFTGSKTMSFKIK